SKGRGILIEGYLNYQQWTDKEGKNRSKLEVVVENFQFLGDRGGGGGGGEAGRAGGGGGYGQRGGYQGGRSAPSADEPPPMDDDQPPQGDAVPLGRAGWPGGPGVIHRVHDDRQRETAEHGTECGRETCGSATDGADLGITQSLTCEIPAGSPMGFLPDVRH